MKILLYPNNLLRQESLEVDKFDDELCKFTSLLAEEMYAHHGVGIAALQVGINKRIIIVDANADKDDSFPLVMVNPRIIESSGNVTSREGCLSIPDVRGDVLRSKNIVVEYQTVSGEKLTLNADGLQSNVIQHEIDHLDGVLFIDKIKKP